MQSPPRESLADRLKQARTRQRLAVASINNTSGSAGEQLQQVSRVGDNNDQPAASIAATTTTATNAPSSNQQPRHQTVYERRIMQAVKLSSVAPKMSSNGSSTGASTSSSAAAAAARNKAGSIITSSNPLDSSSNKNEAKTGFASGRRNHRITYNFQNAVAAASNKNKKEDESEISKSASVSQASSSSSGNNVRWRNLHHTLLLAPKQEEAEDVGSGNNDDTIKEEEQVAAQKAATAQFGGSSRWNHRNFHDDSSGSKEQTSLAVVPTAPPNEPSVSAASLKDAAKAADSVGRWNRRTNISAPGTTGRSSAANMVAPLPEPNTLASGTSRWNRPVQSLSGATKSSPVPSPLVGKTYSYTSTPPAPQEAPQSQASSPPAPQVKSPDSSSLGMSNNSFPSASSSPLGGSSPTLSQGRKFGVVAVTAGKSFGGQQVTDPPRRELPAAVLHSPPQVARPAAGQEITSVPSWKKHRNLVQAQQRPAAPTPEIQQQKFPEKAQTWTAPTTSAPVGVVVLDPEDMPSPVSAQSSYSKSPSASPPSADRSIRPRLLLGASPERPREEVVPETKPQSLVSGMKARFVGHAAVPSSKTAAGPKYGSPAPGVAPRKFGNAAAGFDQRNDVGDKYGGGVIVQAPDVRFRGGKIEQVATPLIAHRPNVSSGGVLWPDQLEDELPAITEARSYQNPRSIEKAKQAVAATLNHAADLETSKSWYGQESRPGFHGGAKLETKRSPLFARTHPSAGQQIAGVVSPLKSINHVSKEIEPNKLSSSGGYRGPLSGAPNNVNSNGGTPVTGFRVPTIEATQSDDDVPTPEKDATDPAEESGIGEKSVWMSPRSARLRALAEASDKGQPATDMYRPKVKKSDQLPSAAKKNENTTIKTPERIAVSLKKAQGWQSPRSARLKALEAADNHEPCTDKNRPMIDETDTLEESATAFESHNSTIETPAKTSVSDMKAKLWGSGKTEKLIVEPKSTVSPYKTNQVTREATVDKKAEDGGRGSTFGSPNLAANATSGIANARSMFQPKPKSGRKFGSPNVHPKKTLQNTPLSPQPYTSKNAALSPPRQQKSIRGPPDVCTPHGPVPPQRAVGRGSHEVDDDDVLSRVLPPKRDTTPSWIKRTQPTEDNRVDYNRSPPRNNEVVVVDDTEKEKNELPTAPSDEALQEAPELTPSEDALQEAHDLTPTTLSETEYSLQQMEQTDTLSEVQQEPAEEELPVALSPERNVTLTSPLPPRPSSRNTREIVNPQTSQDSTDPSSVELRNPHVKSASPPVELSSLHRCPSVGDFQVASSSAMPPTVETVSDDSGDDLELESLSPPQALPRSPEPAPKPPVHRPINMAQLDSLKQPSGLASPPRASSPTKIPRFSPGTLERRLAAGFAETIDCPPYDDAESKWTEDMDITGSKEAIEVVKDNISETSEIRSKSPSLSPRPKQQRPWTKDANTLSPSSWQKRTMQAMDDDAIPPSKPPRSIGHSEVEAAGEEKKSNDEFMQEARSPRSLLRMAADSNHAIDYEKAVQGLPRRTFSSEDEESLLSTGAAGCAIPAEVPPEFEMAISGGGVSMAQKTSVPVFGDPKSFGAAGGEEVAAPPLKVADRAKAIASWNGGLGVAPQNDKQEIDKLDILHTLSPIRHERSDTEGEGMSPRVAKRGFAIEDWKRNKSFDSKAELDPSSDFWQPTNLENCNDDNDWARCDFDLDDRTAISQAFVPPSPARALLEKPNFDTEQRTKKNRRKQHKDQVPPKSLNRQAGTGPVFAKPFAEFSKMPSDNFVFDPFGDPYGDKIEFTEATDFTEGTDFFVESADPFVVESVALSPPREQFTPKPSEEDYYHHDDDSSPPHLANLAPPSGSGSQYELWSYDADTSNIHDGAAEI